jgi:integrase
MGIAMCRRSGRNSRGHGKHLNQGSPYESRKEETMSRGLGRVYQRGDVFWLDYTVGGKRHREPTEAASKSAAKDILRERIGDRKSGKLAGRPDHVRLAEYLKDAEGKQQLVGGLRWLHEKQYDLDGLRSKERIQQYWKHVEEFFGADTRAVEITPTGLDNYAAFRLKQGAARQTVNNELAALRRGFRLAVEKGLLSVVPVFKLPKVKNARTGFFEDGDVAALLLELPKDARADVVEFLYHTGWRSGEGRLLQWAFVDMAGESIRLEQSRSKSGRPRVFPFRLSPPLKALLQRRREQRNGPYVFHLDGQRIGKGALRSAWARATKRTGLREKLIHDLRRSAARNLRRAGVPEGVIMALCGWETRSMFDRYDIINEEDLAVAMAKRYGTVAAQSEAAEVRVA